MMDDSRESHASSWLAAAPAAVQDLPVLTSSPSGSALATPAAAPDGAIARVLPCHPSIHYVAFPQHVTIEAIETPAITPIPGIPYYAYGLVRWHEQWLPLIQLDSLVMAYPLPSRHMAPRYTLILAYQTRPGGPIEHGALAINDLPLSVLVSNDDACTLPDSSDLWANIAISCFTYQGHATPIIDTGKLFGVAHEG